MKKIISAILLGASLLGCAGKEKVHPLKEHKAVHIALGSIDETIEQKTWRHDVQQEVSKHDLWIKDYLRTQSNPKGIAFVLAGEKEGKTVTTNLLHANAWYDSESNTVYLPVNVDKSEVLDAFDHELFHAMFAETKGVLNSADYSGPDLKTIDEYCNARRSSDDFKKRLSEHLRNSEVLRIRQTCEYIDNLNRSIKNSELDSNMFYMLIGMMESEQDLKDSFSKLPEELNKKVQLAQDQYELKRKNAADPSPAPKIDNSTLETLIESRKNLEAYANNGTVVTTEYLSALKTLNAVVYERMKYTVTTAKERKIAGLKEQMSKTEDVNEKSALEQNVKDAESDTRLTMLDSAFEMSCSDFITDILTAQTALKHQYEKAKYDDALYNSNEFMARVVDSLYSLYFGPMSQNKYQLTEDDLKFLSKFRYKNELLFKKGIEKYALGLQMMQKGVSPSEVKSKLEYADGFEFEDRKYSWPAIDFTFDEPFRQVE